jgi:hypothetical protein
MDRRGPVSVFCQILLLWLVLSSIGAISPVIILLQRLGKLHEPRPIPGNAPRALGCALLILAILYDAPGKASAETRQTVNMPVTISTTASNGGDVEGQDTTNSTARENDELAPDDGPVSEVFYFYNLKILVKNVSAVAARYSGTCKLYLNDVLQQQGIPLYGLSPLAPGDQTYVTGMGAWHSEISDAGQLSTIRATCTIYSSA